MTKLKARQARIRVVRQLQAEGMRPRVQAPHTHISEELDGAWREHFSPDEPGGMTAPIELGMIAILYLTGSRHVSAERVAGLLTRTFPDLSQSLASNVHALAEAMGDNPQVG